MSQGEIETRYFDNAEEIARFREENPDYEGACDCPSDPSTWNEELIQAARDMEAGIGVKRYGSVEEMFKAWEEMLEEDGDE